MGTYYIYILLVGIFAFVTHIYATNFTGADSNVQVVCNVFAKIGVLSFITLIIAAIFFTRWWHPIAIFVIACIIASALEKIKSIFFTSICIIGMILFSILAWISMLN